MFVTLRTIFCLLFCIYNAIPPMTSPLCTFSNLKVNCVGGPAFPNLYGLCETRILKKKENSNTRKLRKIFRAPGENQTHDPPSSSSDALTTDIIFLCLISTVHWAVQGRFSTMRPCGTCFVWSAECCCNPSHRTSTPGAHCQVMFISPF